MFGNVGGPEFLVIALLSLLLWLLPIAALVWALVTLARLRRGQEQIIAHLAALRSAAERRG